ncbi:DUF4189 domain-containing protein [Rhizobium sp. PP-CC-3G-465]|uniref:DUF4189 domain-containing protein n=1 Tax=Rhizobium sp. PP-CC-3G-465 TaxID=2135648 RepID=UPI0010428E08|nr:uncharacterized protein DUF4189 [Rhizobium sp. PP-CC-3G-465]
MGITVRLDTATGEAVLTLATALPAGRTLRLALVDLKRKRYLTPSGWVAGRKTLLEVTPQNEQTHLVIDAAIAARVLPASELMLEEININLRERFVWPSPPVTPPVIVPVEAEVAPAPSAAPADSPTLTPPLPRQVHAGLALCAGVAIGAVVGFMALQLRPAAAVLPPVPQAQAVPRDNSASTVPSPESLEVMRNKLKSQQTAIQNPTGPTSQVPTPETPSRVDQIEELKRQAEALRLDRANVEARVAVQAEMLQQQDTEISALKQSLATLGETGSVSSQPDPASWLAAAVSSAGSVESITNQLTYQGAELIALKLCGTSQGCQLVGSYENSCLSLSRPEGEGVRPDNWWQGVDSSWQASEHSSLYECERGSRKKCTIRFTACSPSALAKP